MAKDAFDHIFVQPRSFDTSLAFYRDTLGWAVMHSWGGEGNPRGAILGTDAMSVVLAEHHDAGDHSKSHGINGTRPTVHLRVDDIERRYREIAEAHPVPFAPERTHWGSRWFVVGDPDGNLIAFEQPDG